MIRLQELLLSLAAAGIVAALVMTGRTGSGDRGWDPRESQAVLFRSQDAMPVGASYLSTGPTLTRWAGSTVAPQVRPAVLRSGQVKGVLISLVQEPAIASVVPPPVCFFASIQAVGQQNQACSTAATQYNSGSGCSVNLNNNTGANQACSTSAAQTYCSTNVNNGAGPSYCSAAGTGVKTQSAFNMCSAGQGASASCSTQANPQNTGNTSYSCSAGVQPNSAGTLCSTNTFSGAPSPGAGYCSTYGGTIPANTTQNNGCSVINDGVQGNSNACSTSTTNKLATTCSTKGLNLGAGNTTDWCSVASNAFLNAVCTTTASGVTSGQPGFCSAAVGGANNCSTYIGPNNIQGPNANGQCGNLQ